MKDINPNSTEISSYLTECKYAEIRQLDFSTYPEFVQNLYQYRWKPIVISDALKSADLVLYIDASVVVNQSNSATFKASLKW